jgi:peptide/nickel transport system permease protein
MARYIIRRILQAIPLFFLISIIIFVLMQNIGDPVATMGGRQPLDEKDQARLRCQLGLNDPVLVQYAYWLVGNDWRSFACEEGATPAPGTRKGILRGDFGTSLSDRRPVLQVIGDRIPNTLLLMIPAQLLIIVIGLGIGIFSALRQYSFMDNVLTGVSYVFQSMPIFLIALLLIYIFSVNFKAWGLPALPPNGMYDPLGDRSPGDVLLHMILPVLSLTLISCASYARFTRASMLETMNADYVRTARAKGMSERRINMIHVLKNACLPLVTLIGLDLGGLIAGATVTESLFSWPGLGSLFLDKLGRSDFPVLMGMFVLFTVSIIVFQLLTDIAYTWFDPRIRY